jgi:replicative DNA helicase
MSSPSAALVRQTIRRMVHENKIQMVGIDYLQLMDNGLTNQVDDISMSSKNMRASSIELGIPHFDVAQLNRAIETRSDGAEPMLSDLRGSGCVAGETLVVMADGTRKRIDSLVGENVPVMALNQETMKLQPALASKVWMTGERQVFKLTTSLGNEIKATTNHKFLTVSGWKRLDEIQRGECIATSEVKWDQVIDIAQDDVVPVYDAEVPVHHNFIAGEIVVHNSIEQDHTAVVFIRSPWTAPTEEDMRAFPENIDPRTNRTLDRPKVIPVHFFVAKNRNGEMGKSDLVKWNKATGAFQTLVRE